MRPVATQRVLLALCVAFDGGRRTRRRARAVVPLEIGVLLKARD